MFHRAAMSLMSPQCYSVNRLHWSRNASITARRLPIRRFPSGPPQTRCALHLMLRIILTSLHSNPCPKRNNLQPSFLCMAYGSGKVFSGMSPIAQLRTNIVLRGTTCSLFLRKSSAKVAHGKKHAASVLKGENN